MTFLPVDACTLPVAEQPLRVQELQALLADARVLAATDTRVALRLPADALERVEDLVARESACCTFFAFTVTPHDGGVDVVVEVPQERAGVLSRLMAR